MGVGGIAREEFRAAALNVFPISPLPFSQQWEQWSWHSLRLGRLHTGLGGVLEKGGVNIDRKVILDELSLRCKVDPPSGDME